MISFHCAGDQSCPQIDSFETLDYNFFNWHSHTSIVCRFVVRVLRSTVGTGTPYAVSVASGDELSLGNAGAYLEEALRALPGLQIQNRFNLAVGERLSIRGFGPRAQFGVRGVRILVDGIPATLPDGQATLDHLDLAA